MLLVTEPLCLQGTSGYGVCCVFSGPRQASCCNLSLEPGNILMMFQSRNVISVLGLTILGSAFDTEHKHLIIYFN